MSKKNPLTASERRGILIVAAISLLVTGGGMLINRCGRPDSGLLEENVPQVEVLLSQDSLEAASSSDSAKSAKKRSKRKSARTGKMRADSVSGSKKSPKVKRVYRRRTPLDELVND